MIPSTKVVMIPGVRYDYTVLLERSMQWSSVQRKNKTTKIVGQRLWPNRQSGYFSTPEACSLNTVSSKNYIEQSCTVNRIDKTKIHKKMP